MALRDLTLGLFRRRASGLLWQASQRLAYPPDFSDADVALCRAVAGHTMTSPERIVALAEAVRYVCRNRIPGAVVECGVWRGGSMMAAALTLKEQGDTSRELVLFDTFEGMSPPAARDVNLRGTHADLAAPKGSSAASQEVVAAGVASTGYPMDRVRLVKGKVEETIPAHAPGEIALLRLDTDWYASTLHELEHLYPRLSRGGVLIIDDYGHWKGAKEAVDVYFQRLSPRPMLSRIDYTGRSCIRP
ncbi:MAG TPA: TylF/MycF/NovP-related O-methyltransferase [Myxococcales bacterium]|nr:TylF/MycF/NovP-related O-methyltransferase [Myxococcales bacterium]